MSFIFNPHINLIGEHAFLSPSRYAWTNYDEEKLINSYSNYTAAQRGTELHDFAATCIRLKQKLPATKKTLNQYVNDAIGFRMIPEQPLYFSENCFGTCDAISFKNNFLRIHDLKTGDTPASLRQLEIYAAIFCLEYKIKPSSIKIELRIYQSNDIQVENPGIDVILPITDKIITFDKVISKMKAEAGFDG